MRRLILKVALQIGANVAVEPDTSIRGRGQFQRRRWKTAATSQHVPIFGAAFLVGQQLAPSGIGRGEQVFPATALSEAALFPSCHRPEREIAGTAGQ